MKEEIVFSELIHLKREGLLGEIVAEHTMELIGNEVTESRLNFTADMLSELGKLCFKTSEKIKEAVK